MAHAALGVIGHVNHGKTSLVRALSGIDTDRLEEEKRRGMSIVLGFAWLQLPQGTLDLVDVPGHEQFVRTMVSGATGIQASLLVVDAREGIKPQTVEHVAIADLLGVQGGVVAITKCDLVDEARRATVGAELTRFLRGTHLATVPRVFTSSASGEGLDALRAALGGLLEAEPAVSQGLHAWLPIDRIFSLPGHGTVATGTLRGGSLRVGETLSALPRGPTAVVRQLQVHNRPVEQAFAGQRVGVNLRQVGPQELSRGIVLAPPGRTAAADRLDAQLRLLDAGQANTCDGRRVRLLLGTNEVGAVLRVLGTTGAGALLIQMRTDRPVVACVDEAFILRHESPPGTIGGGRILDPAARRHRRSEVTALARLQVLAGGGARQRLAEQLRAAGCSGLCLAELATAARLPAAELEQAVQAFALSHQGRLWHLPLVYALQARLVEGLRTYHRTHPLRPLAPLSVCRSALPAEVGDPLYRRLLEGLQSDGRLVRSEGSAALAGHDPMQTLDPARRDELQSLSKAFREGGMTPPDLPRVQAKASIVELLVARGELLLLPAQPPAPRVALHRDAFATARERLASAFPPPKGFTVSEARELLGSTRKYTVPLLEHLHATGQTLRRGDRHMFRLTGFPGGE